MVSCCASIPRQTRWWHAHILTYTNVPSHTLLHSSPAPLHLQFTYFLFTFSVYHILYQLVMVQVTILQLVRAIAGLFWLLHHSSPFRYIRRKSVTYLSHCNIWYACRIFQVMSDHIRSRHITIQYNTSDRFTSIFINSHLVMRHHITQLLLDFAKMEA